MLDFLTKNGRLVQKIVQRSYNLHLFHPEETDRKSIALDIKMVHKAYPMDLRGLLDSTDSDFSHEILGFAYHLDRTAARLHPCFVPKFLVNKKTP